jgi:hypothetical protein
VHASATATKFDPFPEPSTPNLYEPDDLESAMNKKAYPNLWPSGKSEFVPKTNSRTTGTLGQLLVKVLKTLQTFHQSFATYMPSIRN